MTGDPRDELLGVYALDAVDDDERRIVEEYLDESPRARAEVRQHLEVAAFLANTGVAAPDGIWSRIAAELDGDPPSLSHGRSADDDADASRPDPPSWLTTARDRPDPLPGPGPGPSSSFSTRLAPVTDLRTRSGRRVAAALAAAAILAVAALGAAAAVRSSSTEDPASVVAMVDEAVDRTLADPTTRAFELRSGDGAVRVRAGLRADGLGVLDASELPDLPPDRTYQVWGFVGDRVVSLAVIGSSPEKLVFPVDLSTSGLAITEEIQGGVVSSSNDAIVSGVYSS